MTAVRARASPVPEHCCEADAGSPTPTWNDWQDFIWLSERASVLWIRFWSTRKWMSSTLEERGGGRCEASGHRQPWVDSVLIKKQFSIS